MSLRAHHAYCLKGTGTGLRCSYTRSISSRTTKQVAGENMYVTTPHYNLSCNEEFHWDLVGKKSTFTQHCGIH